MNIKARAKDVVKYEAFGDAGGVIEELVSQLEKVEAERDAALSRIADLEDSRDGTTIVKLAEAEARIAEAAKLHYRDMGGDCAECLDPTGRYYVSYPCPTAVALGLNEGEVAGDE